MNSSRQSPSLNLRHDALRRAGPNFFYPSITVLLISSTKAGSIPTKGKGQITANPAIYQHVVQQPRWKRALLNFKSQFSFDVMNGALYLPKTSSKASTWDLASASARETFEEKLLDEGEPGESRIRPYTAPQANYFICLVPPVPFDPLNSTQASQFIFN